MKHHRMNKAFVLAGALALVLILFSGIAAKPAQAAEAVDDYLIVALGDSITAGYEPGMTEQSVPYGFVERLREQGLFHERTSAVNYGILGLTSEGLKITLPRSRRVCRRLLQTFKRTCPIRALLPLRRGSPKRRLICRRLI